MKERISAFRDATANEAVRQSICASCAREVFHRDGSMISVGDIPNIHLLEPRVPHPAHNLSSSGALLHPRSYSEDEDVFICRECFSHLLKDRMPRLSLANNMWIGDIPSELKYLSQPEKILIALYLPVAYIYKLYPKGDHGKQWRSDKLHFGLRGNVSTFKLDQTKIASMINGTMPNSPEILASTIGVSFVGPKNKVERWIRSGLPKNFFIQRARVARALHWLKAHNPLYASITISEERLSQLPENGVPEEILVTARESNDTGALDAEHASYVPADDETDNIIVDGMSLSDICKPVSILTVHIR